MIKRTLFFSSPCFLSVKNSQLVRSARTEPASGQETQTFPIEDIGFVVLESPQIALTQPVLQSLIDNNAAVITCDSKHMPAGMMLCLDSNNVQQEIFEAQVSAPKPLVKRLWKQTVEAKISNQAALLAKLGRAAPPLSGMLKSVRSGDPKNVEASAARIYWKSLFISIPSFSRNSDGQFPNNLLNYGYAILRAATARALAGSGLLCTLGIHHCNRYNAFCLADDIMEPYRPFVDEAAVSILESDSPPEQDLSRASKAAMLSILACDTSIGGKRRPLMISLSETSASLARCFTGKEDSISYPAVA